MAGRRDHKRVLIYSHDSFGLGHLRRCRAIAHSLVDTNSSVSVLDRKSTRLNSSHLAVSRMPSSA